jgi:predicted metal-dependent peptidase
VDFYSCDTELHGPSTLDSTEVAMPELRGGGGTSFEPFFEALKAANPPPDTAVYLTDGFGDFPKKAPSFPTLWVITPGGMQEDHFPFGETARMRSS